MERIFSWYAENEKATRDRLDDKFYMNIDDDNDTVTTYPLGTRSTSSMEDDYARTVEERDAIETPCDDLLLNETTAIGEDGIYISLDEYRKSHWRNCQAMFRRSTGDLLSDEVDQREEIHMTLPNSPSRTPMPPFSVYYGLSKEDMEWRKQGVGGSTVGTQKARIGNLRLPPTLDADKIIFTPSAHAA